MLDKILTYENSFRIFCLILFAIIFFLIFRKNKKEKFSQLSTQNLQAINNLNVFASNLKKGGEHTFPGILKVNTIKIGTETVNQGYLNDIKNSALLKSEDGTLNGN